MVGQWRIHIKPVSLKIDNSGSIQWLSKDGRRLHRNNDLPALICYDGTQIWCKNGKIHRESDLPAAIYVNGNRYWFKNNKRHRDNGLPAVIYNNGDEEYWINGQRRK